MGELGFPCWLRDGKTTSGGDCQSRRVERSPRYAHRLSTNVATPSNLAHSTLSASRSERGRNRRRSHTIDFESATWQKAWRVVYQRRYGTETSHCRDVWFRIIEICSRPRADTRIQRVDLESTASRLGCSSTPQIHAVSGQSSRGARWEVLTRVGAPSPTTYICQTRFTPPCLTNDRFAHRRAR